MKNNIYITLVVLTVLLVISGCGGGVSTGVIPNNVTTNPLEPAATPGTLIQVPGNPTNPTVPSNLPTGTFKVEVKLPGSASTLKAKDLTGSDLPYDSQTLRVTITGEAITSPIIGERNDLDPSGAGTYTLTVPDVPVGLNTATIEVLNSSEELLCQRKHGFYMTPGATEGPGLIVLGVAIEADGSYTPENIDIPAGSTISFQNHDYINDRTASMNGGTVTAGPIGHATHITQPVTAEVFPAINKLFNTEGQFNYDGHNGRVLVYGLPTITSITDEDGDNMDSNTDTSTVTFTIRGTNFGTDQYKVNGEVRFIQIQDNDPNNPWGTDYDTSGITSWTDNTIEGSIELAGGKYRIEVSVRGENTTETVFFYKGTGTYQVIVGDPNETNVMDKMILITGYTGGDFYIGKYEVTNEDYKLYDTSHNGSWSESDYPVESVSWEEACDYCNWLSTVEGFVPAYNSYQVVPGANGYRLPFQAEWEYACRAGSVTDYFWGENYPPDDSPSGLIYQYCWCGLNNTGNPHPVNSLSPNPFGLYNMTGNIWEWCTDQPELRVGGCFEGPSYECTSSYIDYCSPNRTDGFRLVRKP